MTTLTRCHSPHLILAAARFPEVSDGGELCVDGLGVEPAIIQVHDGLLCILLTTELHRERTPKITKDSMRYVSER